MSESTKASTFACPACGKTYPWKPALAGKKGKCKCGSVMSIPLKLPSAPPPPPAEDEIYDVGGDQAAEAPAYSPPPTTTTAPARAPKVIVERPDDSPKKQLKWAAAAKWYIAAFICAAWALWELSDPTVSGRRGIRAVLMLVNMLHPMGGFFLLAAGAAFFGIVGTLILLGKARDSDYEHEQEKDKWVSSRGRR